MNRVPARSTNPSVRGAWNAVELDVLPAQKNRRQDGCDDEEGLVFPLLILVDGDVSDAKELPGEGQVPACRILESNIRAPKRRTREAGFQLFGAFCIDERGESRQKRGDRGTRAAGLGRQNLLLSTHAVVGAAIGSLLPSHPVAAALLGFASHFPLDAIPHWDYPIRSAFVNPAVGGRLKRDRALMLDAVTIGADALLGLVGSALLFATPTGMSAVMLGACGAILPDPLQFVHAHFPREPFRSLQRFHRWMHTKKPMRRQVAWGIVSQVMLVVMVVALAKAAHDAVLATIVAWGAH
jgi:hypothetical protein